MGPLSFSGLLMGYFDWDRVETGQQVELISSSTPFVCPRPPRYHVTFMGKELELFSEI